MMECFQKTDSIGKGDAAYIWSVLWHGRMAPNGDVFRQYRTLGKPVIISEIGSLDRGNLWRLSANGIDRNSIWPLTQLDPDRPKTLGINLSQWKSGTEIVICCQHEKSQQWDGMPSTKQYILDTVSKIRMYSDRPIVVRPHPRFRFQLNLPGVTVIDPVKITGSYDSFDFVPSLKTAHCVVSHNGNSGVEAAIHGVPVICHSTSHAYPVSNQIENIEALVYHDREEWLINHCHTEWTIDELSYAWSCLRELILSQR